MESGFPGFEVVDRETTPRLGLDKLAWRLTSCGKPVWSCEGAFHQGADCPGYACFCADMGGLGQKETCVDLLGGYAFSRIERWGADFVGACWRPLEEIGWFAHWEKRMVKQYVTECELEARLVIFRRSIGTTAFFQRRSD